MSQMYLHSKEIVLRHSEELGLGDVPLPLATLFYMGNEGNSDSIEVSPSKGFIYGFILNDVIKKDLKDISPDVEVIYVYQEDNGNIVYTTGKLD